MERINLAVLKALKTDRILPRPHASPGVWVSFLLPSAVIISCLKAQNVTELYTSSAIYSFNTLLNVIHLLFHIMKNKSVNVTKNANILCAIPIMISIYLYKAILDMDLRRSLCHSVANGLIYFEGIPFLFKAFPRTFTLGEANIMIQGFSLFMYGLFLSLNYIMLKGPFKSEYDMSTVILQISLSCITVLCIVPYTHTRLRQTIPVYLMGFSTLLCIYFAAFSVLNCELFTWFWDFLTKSERIGIIILWLVCSTIAVVIVQNQINKKRKSNTVIRKYFHGLAVAVFLSGILLDINLIYFSSGCVLCLFIVLEVFRVLKLPPLYTFLNDGFSVFCDEKDSGVIAMTPICLLVGSALPLWIHPIKGSSNGVHLQLLSGVLSVGIGDTFASIGGKVFGKHKWKGSSKTIEGTVLGVLSQVVFIQILISSNAILLTSDVYLKAFLAILVTSLVEAKTDQIDNIVLPLTMYILLTL